MTDLDRLTAERDAAKKDAAEADYVLRVTGEKLTMVKEQRDAYRAMVERVRTLCHRDGYTTWDADEKLPNPPYKPDDPAVVAWEKAHGHDFRLKCYAEYGCQLLLDPEDILAALDADV